MNKVCERIICNECGEKGHLARDCKKLRCYICGGQHLKWNRKGRYRAESNRWQYVAKGMCSRDVEKGVVLSV